MMSKHSRRKKASKAVAPWHQQKRDDGAISSVILDGVPHVHHGDHVHIPDVSLGARWEPAVNVKETAEKYIISAELPGVDKNDLKVSIRDGVLMLSGQRRGIARPARADICGRSSSMASSSAASSCRTTSRPRR